MYAETPYLNKIKTDAELLAGRRFYLLIRLPRLQQKPEPLA
jgi:hypothetical protein